MKDNKLLGVVPSSNSAVSRCLIKILHVDFSVKTGELGKTVPS